MDEENSFHWIDEETSSTFAFEKHFIQLTQQIHSLEQKMDQMEKMLQHHITTQQQMDIRQQNMNLRQAIPFAFVPQQKISSPLPPLRRNNNGGPCASANNCSLDDSLLD